MSMIISFFSFPMLISSFLLIYWNKMLILEFPILFLNFSMKLTFILDWMSSMFSCVVTIISSMVLMFSMVYISKEDYYRFSLILFIFMMSMIILIFSNNLIFLMIGWDGLGISSYILVIFYQDSKSLNSGAITIFSNRIGDVCILLSISTLMILSTWELHLNKIFPFISLTFLLLASMTKSAQIPFSSWLPAAMAAPTPISALVHSSTLVTAGIYLSIRFLNFNHPLIISIIIFSSLTTLILSSITASMESDAKKIIAYSTLSQIAIMMFSVGLGNLKVAFFHLITHALFKSTLFLCAGYSIHNSSYQDMRFMNFNYFDKASLSSIISISSSALLGLPFLAGFYSKDMIIEFMLVSSFNQSIVMLMCLSLGMTPCYSIRLLYILFSSEMKKAPEMLLKSNSFLTYPLFLLSPFSVFLGALISWTLPFNNHFTTPLSWKISFLILILLGFLLSFLLNSYAKKLKLLEIKSLTLFMLNILTTKIPSKMLKFNFLFFPLEKNWNDPLMTKYPLDSSMMLSNQKFILSNSNILIFLFSILILLIFIFIFSLM
uniref:NADH-ubiquinone oxidoreductase chain 5 n=1 Tax=Atypus karschi TaxID=2337319 RepID=A0A8A5Y7F4_9ARAC|nr:NADH dehydrogenase subunit 5 [Atypus karschi]QTH31101.1 NADH dehydrogenase subunit 5 [Atypus karschi]